MTENNQYQIIHTIDDDIATHHFNNEGDALGAFADLLERGIEGELELITPTTWMYRREKGGYVVRREMHA